MNGKKNLILSLMAIVILLGVGGISYKYLSNKYQEKQNTYSETSDESENLIIFIIQKTILMKI